MNNTVLRVISALLAVGALGVAYLAIQLSKSPAAPTPVPAPVASSKVSVATTTRTIPAGQMLSADDITLTVSDAPPPQALRQVQDAVGRITATELPVRTTLLPIHFAPDTLAQLLKPGERAVAVQVDEVVGVGGFAQPGETVDVLAFLPKDGENQGSAQTVVEDARLLTIGEGSALEQQAHRAPGTAEALTKEAGGKSTTEGRAQRQNMRSAVLAVRETEVNRLMLAANIGVLRLALRPLNVSLDANTSKPPQAPGRAQMVVKMSDLGYRPAASGQQRGGRKLVIQEGRQEREVTVDKKETP